MATDKQSFTKSDQHNPPDNGGIYEIKIKGLLDNHWKQWFEGMVLSHVRNGETEQECTLITGPISDQPALHGLLAKIRDLNLTLLSVYRIYSETNKHEKTPINLPLADVPSQKAIPDDLETNQGQ